MTYDMQVREFVGRFGPDGRDVAWIDWNGQRYEATTRNGATCKLARLLVAAGAADGAWRCVWADGRVRFSGPSLHQWATRTISEPDRGIMQIVPWSPMPVAALFGDVQDGA